MNINTGNTSSTFSFDEWEKSALSELVTLQNRVSKALLKYQGSADKAAVGESATRYMGELKAVSRRLQKATPAIQQKVDDIADMLHLMAHFSGITFDE
ncbi:hypothetical protein [Enterobacter cancerogenus]|uniref:hypothetical protein n=1 Tax=Enterobacter cancerogenus TaxID=69218 RepID=UPI002360F751|nr:hypothetical protein [Enterobacter cancerogenus]